mgnify:CR=1 FL=1
MEGITEYRLPNGLQVLLIPDDTKPTTTVNVTYRVGSRHEGYGETGMAHLLEHLIFKGSPRHPQVWAEFNKRGLSANGTTWYDRTNYFASFAANDDNLKWYLNWQADAMVKQLLGRSGTVAVSLLSVESLGAKEDHLLLAAQDNTGAIHDAETVEKLLSVPAIASALPPASPQPNTNAVGDLGQPGLDFNAAYVPLSPALEQEINRQKSIVLSGLETRNLAAFTQETDKLDTWADDLKVSLEREIKELDRRIKEARTLSKGAATLAEKLAAQKIQRDLEALRDRRRRELFERQDEIQAKRDGLIDELEKQLKQNITATRLFAAEWEVY